MSTVDIIHEYSYTPDLVFHGKGLRHFGVELEIDDGGTVNSNAQKLLDIANARTLKTCTSRRTAVWMKAWSLSRIR